MIRSTLATAIAFLGLAHPALAQTKASANYVLTLGGINVARMQVDLNDTGRRYDLDVNANVAGLGTLVASGTAKASASGNSAGNSLVADSFDLQTKANGETFDVTVSFANKSVSAFKVDPPVLDSWDRVALERSHLTGVGDFVSAFVIKAGALDKSICERRMNIFTGVERFNLAMSFVKTDEATSPRTGYQGPVVLCSIKYQPISGHYASSEMTTYLADTSRILVWFAPLGATGYFIPYRVLLGTSAGDLSMVLVSANS